MPSLNIYAATGHICAKPDARQCGETQVATLRLAVDDSYKSKNGEKVDRAVFVDVEAWGKAAEIACQYLDKGSAVAIAGKLVMDTWDDKETGQKRSKLKVRANDFGGIVFIGGKGGHSVGGNATPDRPPVTEGTTDEEIPF